jgi:hypothetical protein
MMVVQDFLKLSLIVPRLLAPRIALDSRDFVVYLAFSGVSQVVPLAFVGVVVVVAALLVVLRLGKHSFSSSSWSAHHTIMSWSSTAAVGRLHLKSW